MKVSKRERVFAYGVYRKELLGERKAKHYVSGLPYRLRKRHILRRFLGEEYVYPDDDRAVALEMVDHPGVVGPLEVLESSESRLIGKAFVVDGDDQDRIVGDRIGRESSEEYIANPEIRELDDRTRKARHVREWKIFRAQEKNAQEDDDRDA